MTEPLITVVIPTAGRPESLLRAIDSALAGMAPGEVEVIVVPNGTDISWRKALARYGDNPAVRVLPVETGHANVARNHGMRHARGRYIRFLDDDDVLYSEGARRQYAEITRLDGDVCSGSYAVVDRHMSVLMVQHQSQTDDFISGLMGQTGMWQPTAHVFRRAAVAGGRWDESLDFCQDFDWMRRVCEVSELKWVRCEQVVGAWCRHLGTGITRHASIDAKKRVIARGIQALIDRLEAQGRLTPERRTAAAVGLWNCVHSALCFSPVYWTAIARQARTLSPESRPAIALYEHPLARRWGPDPLLWEWLLAPKRLVTYWLRRVWVYAGWARYG